jgi:hypothetical protein
MEDTTIESLIAQKRVVKRTDLLDPTNDYIVVGVYQNGTNKSKGDGTSYKNYAIPISEIAGNSVSNSNKNIIVVDSVFGDDASAAAAGNYDFNKPFQTIDNAVANANTGDTLWLMPGGVYFVLNNLLDKELTIYAWNCTLQFRGPQTGSIFTALTIKGNADIYIVSGAAFNTTPCVLANINIECNALYAFEDVPFYLDHQDYSQACYFTLKANYLDIQGVFFAFIALNYNVNVDVTTLERPVVAAPPFTMGDFWFTNLGAGAVTGFNTTSRFNFGSTNISSKNGHSLIKLDYGAPENKYFVTGNYFAENNAGIYRDISAPTAIVSHDTSQSFVEIDATMNLIGVSVYVSRGAASQAIIKGNIIHDSNTYVSDFASCYYIRDGKLKLYADTRSIGNQILVVPAVTALTPQIDINNCKLVNAGGLLNIILNLQAACTLRIFNAKFIVDLANTFSATASTTLLAEVYSLYDNVAMDATIGNSLGTGSPDQSIGELTNTNMTDIGF